MRLTENWLGCWAHRIVVSSTKSSWKLVCSVVPQGVVGSILFNIFNDLGDGTECTFRKFVGHTKLGVVADKSHDCAAIQKDLERLNKWADRNTVKFCERKCQVLPLGGNNCMHQY